MFLDREETCLQQRDEAIHAFERIAAERDAKKHRGSKGQRRSRDRRRTAPRAKRVGHGARGECRGMCAKRCSITSDQQSNHGLIITTFYILHSLRTVIAPSRAGTLASISHPALKFKRQDFKRCLLNILKPSRPAGRPVPGPPAVPRPG